MKLIVDANSLLNQALLRGTDHEDGRVVKDDAGKEHQVNSAQYGVDGFWGKVRDALSQFEVAPRKVILVWDGAGAKARRRTYLPTYKEGRDKIPEVSEQLNMARDICTAMALKLGMHVISQRGYEADDVIGYLVKNLRHEPNTVVSNDGDLAVLYDSNTDIWTGSDLNKNPFGGFPHKYITLYKSLVGDNGDKIPGAFKFGDAAFVNLVRIFGLDGLEEVERMIVTGKLDELKDSVADLPALQRILDNKDMVATSWRCASLFIDEINTPRKPLEIQAGMVVQWDPKDPLQVPEMRKHYGTTTLVTAANYADVYKRFVAVVGESPFVPLDIETSSSEESDEWIEAVNTQSKKRGNKIDVLGHELTGMSLTFGANTQHTIYMSVDHADTDNITVDQCRLMVEAIPHEKLQTVIQNRQFEFTVLYRTWGDKWADNGWAGMVPNAIDTKIGASYVDENLPAGLKERSKHHLGYSQQTYAETTTLSGPVGWRKGGQQVKTFKHEVVSEISHTEMREVDEEMVEVKVIDFPAEYQEWETRQFKMNELTAKEVVAYGADDTICTGALHTHYSLIMELENTWGVYMEVETLPEYLTSLAFVQGIPISLGNMRQMEEADNAKYDAAWAILKDYLMRQGWEGTQCPVAETVDLASIRAALAVVSDNEEPFTTRKRKIEGVLIDVEEYLGEGSEFFMHILRKGDVEALNAYVKSCFTGDPKLNFNSPSQLQNLFYRVLGITPRIVNKMTPKQRQEDDVMRSAFKKFRKSKGGAEVEYTPEELNSLISKSSTDEDAVNSALALDNLSDEVREVLKAYQVVRKIGTLRSLFYGPYKVYKHWRDGRVHPSLNQCEAATRRYSSSAPNVQQLVKGEGGFREVILAHEQDWVVFSLDLAGQELRLSAEMSGDEAMTSCYVGDNLRDMHSLTAVAAAPIVWREEVTYEQFIGMLYSDDPIIRKKAKNLRGDAKTTNFATAYGAMAPKIALNLMTDEETAQAFIDAKETAFPRLPQWNEEVHEEAHKLGYTTTMLGARRHLASGLNADDRWDQMKAERQAGNFKVQGSGGEMLKLAMCSMWRKRLFTGKYRARFYAPIHDEAVGTVHRDDLIPFLKELHPCMIQQYSTMKIPLESSISIGRTFGTQIEIGTTVDEAKIKEALAELFPA